MLSSVFIPFVREAGAIGEKGATGEITRREKAAGGEETAVEKYEEEGEGGRREREKL